MFKFVFKAGLAAGAVYYINEQGLWRESEESTKVYGKICDATSPYLRQAKAQIPIEFEIPQLPERNKLSYLVKQYWNKGVLATFTFLGDLPQHISNWTQTGVDTAMSNEEIKKFVASFSSSPEAIEPPKK